MVRSERLVKEETCEVSVCYKAPSERLSDRKRERKRMEMRGIVLAGILIAAALLFQAALVLCSFSATLKLERAFPLSQRVELSQLRARDSIRHGRMFQSSNGVVDFPLAGTYDRFAAGLYYTKVQLGSPPKEFYVQIDTGSDVLWVSCNPCNGCPTTSRLPIQLNLFDTGSSSTASLIYCSDQRCSAANQSSDVGCSSQNNQCTYTLPYEDGSGTSGYYVSDLLYFDTFLGGSVTTNSSARIAFGCSTNQTGNLTKSDVDGIFGFGQQEMSVVSQLASQGVAPKAFSHCLRGDETGGGILVLGEILEPNIVYTPLVPSQPHYNLNLQSISVKGQTLSIDPSVFTTSNNQGTIIDSGTTLAYLAEAAYNPFVTAVTNAVSQSAQPVVSEGNQCYLINSSVTDVFPQVSLNFAGGASMILRPQDYLLQPNSVGSSAVWCIGLQKYGLTILGDLVLKDKIFVYDLVGQRIGWANYDCSTSVNVTATMKTGKSEYVNAGQLNDNSSLQNEP